MIHSYTLNGFHVLIDVNSGSVFQVDELISQIAHLYETHSPDQIVNQLKEKYDPKEIEEGIQEIEFLIDQGILYSKDIEFDKSMDHDGVKAMCLHVSHDCNLRCEYCFAAQGNFEGETLLMDLETGKKALDFLVAHSKERYNLEVDFFGGEPLMNFDVVKELVEYARGLEKQWNKNFRFTMTTNGVLLDEEKMWYLDQHMDNVVMSLDGRKDVNDKMRKTVSGEGSYSHIVEKIKRMAAMRGSKDHYVRGTFTSENIDFSKDVLSLKEEGFTQVSVEPVVTDENEPYAIRMEHVDAIKKEYEILAEKYIESKQKKDDFHFFHFNVDLHSGPCAYKRVSGCGAGSDYIAVTPKGELYPCHQFVGEEAFKLGSIYEGFNNKKCKSEFQKANLVNNKECKDCWAKYYCGGGCFANAYYANQSIHKPYEVGCELEKKRIECAIMIKIALENGQELEN